MGSSARALEQTKLTERPEATGVSVSYVITVYNKRPFLPQVIAGLAAQRGDFTREFVFIDDGSTDGSADEIARLTESWRGVKIVTQSNRGSSDATNRGIAEARYPFIKLVDADDVLLPDATSVLLDSLLQHQGAVLAYGRTGLYASQQEAIDRLAEPVPTAVPPRRLEANPLPSQLLRGFSIGPSNSLFSAAAAQKVGGCDARVFTQDYSLVLRLATIGAFVWVGAIVALCPAQAEGRVNDGGPQILHDVNLSIAYFLEDQRLSAALARNAVRRATMRAYHWARRREGAGLFSYWTWLRLLAELPHPAPSLVRESCRAFTLSRPVRPGSA